MDKYTKMLAKLNNSNKSSSLKINFVDESTILYENASLVNENKHKVSIICEKAENLFDKSAQYYEEVISNAN